MVLILKKFTPLHKFRTRPMTDGIKRFWCICTARWLLLFFIGHQSYCSQFRLIWILWGFFFFLHIVSWEPEGRYCSSKMFHWEPEGRYCHWLCTAIAPFWFSTEHLWAAVTPFWLSTDDIYTYKGYMYIFSHSRKMTFRPRSLCSDKDAFSPFQWGTLRRNFGVRYVSADISMVCATACVL